MAPKSRQKLPYTGDGRLLKILSSYIVVSVCYLYLAAYAVLMSPAGLLSTFLIGVMIVVFFVLFFAPFLWLSLFGPRHAISILEPSIYVAGISLLGALSWLIFESGGVTNSFIGWAYEYLFVLSIQIRVYSVTQFSWRAPLVTLSWIVFIGWFIEIQLLVSASASPNAQIGAINAGVDQWTRFGATLIGVVVNQVAIDIVAKYQVAKRALAGMISFGSAPIKGDGVK